ncbi:MAG: ABC transporter substrate-binding protein [Xanthobacteraceae bacterium]|nr:MAG: ABC transporter substrate-binding protein [Xanthobacteraceae bacterium]
MKAGRSRRDIFALAAAALVCGAAPALAQDTVKIGVIMPMTGPFQSVGWQTNAAVKLFIDKNGSTVAGKKIEVILKDDGGVPDNAKRIAQEMIVRDKVNVLFGFGLTPIAMAVAPLATEAKVPMIVTVASTSVVVDRSPYIVRTIQTVPQVANIIGQWSAKSGIKSVVSIVSDYAPGHEMEDWYAKAFEKEGGKVLERVRVPLANPDFAPFLQRARDASPDGIFAFVPAGVGAIFAKQFIERGLDKTGIRFVVMSDVLDDDLLNGMGDPVIGFVSGGPYSIAHDSATNKEFVKAFRAANNNRRPNIVSVSAYDGMEVIYRALKATNGAADGPTLVNAMKGLTWESPRGPVLIDPATRDIVQNVYMRKVERRDGELYSVEFQTFPAVKDPTR